MDDPDSGLRFCKKWFDRRTFIIQNARNRNCFAIYGYTVSCVLLLMLLQFWAFQRKPEWFLLKEGGSVNGNNMGSEKYKFGNAKEWLAHNKAQNLECDIAAMCLPKTFFNTAAMVELTVAEVHCLRKALLDKIAQKQASFDSHMVDAISNDNIQNTASSFMQKNNCSQSGKAEIEALKREAAALKVELKAVGDQLQESVTFLPLKDKSVAATTDPERTWFMSTLRGRSENGNSEYFYFPSDISKRRILCVQGNHTADGTQNFYGFAWQKHLPANSTLVPGLTFVSDNYYDYINPWHSMTALIGFAAWHKENECALPERFVLYHWGELVKTMGSWISDIMHASFGRHVDTDALEYGDGPVCFEKAVVCRQGLGHMSLDKRVALFDMIRCKARKFCNVSVGQRIVNGIQVINLTLVARTRSRSFRNETIVMGLFEKECRKVAGCNFHLFHIDDLSFCDQVSVMSTTDILATVHGGQLTNMIFMSKGSSVMEMFPKGWLELAGQGQYVFHWLASWSGMNHEGTWRDTEGPECPNPEKGPLQCFSFHKDSQVGYNETYLTSWTANVLKKFQHRTAHLKNSSLNNDSTYPTCPCDHVNVA